jgi:hypothetical protein
MDTGKYVGTDVHKETISISVISPSGKLEIESVVYRSDGLATRQSRELVHEPD